MAWKAEPQRGGRRPGVHAGPRALSVCVRVSVCVCGVFVAPCPVRLRAGVRGRRGPARENRPDGTPGGRGTWGRPAERGLRSRPGPALPRPDTGSQSRRQPGARAGPRIPYRPIEGEQ